MAATTGEIVHIPGIAVRIVDATGAGDSFDAGFLAGYLRGDPLERSLALGNACGAMSTRMMGGTEGQPTMEEALEAIERGAAA